MSPRPSEIWLADLGLAAKTRPIVIVSRFDPKAPRALIIYVPLTTEKRESRYEIPIPKLGFLNAPSVTNLQRIASIPSVRLERKLARKKTTRDPTGVILTLPAPSRTVLR
jgi:mRNA interferase MazF